MSCHAELRIMQRSIPIPVHYVEAENFEPEGIPPFGFAQVGMTNSGEIYQVSA